MSALLDRREYVAHMAEQQAAQRVRALEDACWQVIDAVQSPTQEQMQALREWRGIAKACQRERARCTGLKHPTA